MQNACIQVFFSWVASAYYGVSMTTNIEHLPTHLRYTGVALSFTLSYVIFGGALGLREDSREQQPWLGLGGPSQAGSGRSAAAESVGSSPSRSAEQEQAEDC